MPVYLYDATLDGLLCAFGRAIADGDPAPLFDADLPGRQPSLFGGVPVETDAETAREMWDRIVATGGRETARHVLYALLAEADGFETPLCEVVAITLDEERPVLGRRQVEAVRRVVDWTRKVGAEAHLFTGLLRFSELRDGTLYAPYEPDHHVTLLVATHFARRLAAERWVIHDRRRDLAVAWDGQRILPVADMPDAPEALISGDEVLWREMWRRFTRSVSIPNRRNPALQRRFMPRRYWRYLPEMQ